MSKLVEIKRPSDKSVLLDSLLNLANHSYLKNDLEQYWFTQTIYNCIQFELVPQQIYTDKFPEFSFVLVKNLFKGAGYSVKLHTTTRDREVCLSAVREAVSMVHDVPSPSHGGYLYMYGIPNYVRGYLEAYIKEEKYHVLTELEMECMMHFPEKLGPVVAGLDEGGMEVPGFIIGTMSEIDAAVVNECVSYGRHPDFERWVRKTIREKPNVGCWSQETGELVGFILITLSGNVGCYFVKPAFRGRKLGKWIHREMIKQLVDHGYSVMSDVVNNNEISLNIFRSQGFEVVAQSYYVAFEREKFAVSEDYGLR